LCKKGPTNQFSLYSISKEPVRNESVDINSFVLSVKKNLKNLFFRSTTPLSWEKAFTFFQHLKSSKSFSFFSLQQTAKASIGGGF